MQLAAQATDRMSSGDVLRRCPEFAGEMWRHFGSWLEAALAEAPLVNTSSRKRVLASPRGSPRPDPPSRLEPQQDPTSSQSSGSPGDLQPQQSSGGIYNPGAFREGAAQESSGGTLVPAPSRGPELQQSPPHPEGPHERDPPGGTPNLASEGGHAGAQGVDPLGALDLERPLWDEGSGGLAMAQELSSVGYVMGQENVVDRLHHVARMALLESERQARGTPESLFRT